MRTRTFLEIGVGGYTDPYAGFDSLRMWRTFFPRAQVFGLDLHPKIVDEPRITFVQGDQADPDVLNRLVALAGGGFDLVIDDGRHVNEHFRTTFEELFPKIAPGGLYVIEDLETAYYPESGGGRPGAEGTSIALVKGLIDGVNRRYIPATDFLPTHSQQLVSELHFYSNIVFIGRADRPTITHEATL